MFKGARIDLDSQATLEPQDTIALSCSEVKLPSFLLSPEERKEFETLSDSSTFFRSVREDNILWSTTNFFRDQSMTTLPKLLDKKEEAVFPIISYGCSTGEEPYTLHLLLKSRFGSDYNKRFPITAYDLNEHCLESARAGVIHIDRDRDLRLLAALKEDYDFAQELETEILNRTNEPFQVVRVHEFEKVNFYKNDIRKDPLVFQTPIALFIQNSIYHLHFEEQFVLMDKLCNLPRGSLLYLGNDTITDRLIAEILPRTGAFGRLWGCSNVLLRL